MCLRGYSTFVLVRPGLPISVGVPPNFGLDGLVFRAVIGSMGATGRRIALWAVVLAGPGSIVLSAILLIGNRGAFRHGPGVPTAGTPEAWGLLWLVLALVCGGHLLSIPVGVGWLVRRLVRREPVAVPLRLVIVYDVLFLLLVAWFLAADL